MKNSNRIILGVSGASGAVYARRALEALKAAGIESHLVVSKAAEMAIAYELGEKAKGLAALADHAYAISDVGAPIASGSFRTRGMLIAPCSVRTMSEIATGVTSSLLTRAADVVLKEKRRLVLMVRETPLHLGHLRTMTQLAELLTPALLIRLDRVRANLATIFQCDGSSFIGHAGVDRLSPARFEGALGRLGCGGSAQEDFACLPHAQYIEKTGHFTQSSAIRLHII